MNWSDERYVRLYTRETPEWAALPWQARALWPLLLQRMDRAGVLAVRAGPRRIAAVAALVRAPDDFVMVGLGALVDDGCLVDTEQGFIAPNFLAAQESRASDARRAKDYRERRRSEMLEGAPSQNVTIRHDSSHAVTPSRAVPSRAVPSHIPPSEVAPQLTLATVTTIPRPAPAPPPPPAAPVRKARKVQAQAGEASHQKLVEVWAAVYLARTGQPYRYQTADFVQAAMLHRQGVTPDEVGAAAERAFRPGIKDYLAVRSFKQLATRFAEVAVAHSNSSAFNVATAREIAAQGESREDDL